MPKYPIYIISKGRWETRLTADSLEEMQQPYFIVVEKNEFHLYKQRVKGECLVLPEHYKTEYKTCDEFGMEKSVGSGAARNFCLHHARQSGQLKHWLLDDNIDGFYRLNRNQKIKCINPGIFKAAEEFIDRYVNVPLSGFNYAMFAKAKDSPPPFVINTRIYSCMLIDNSIEFEWEGRYNEDTHLSLRVLKSGKCTIQFNAFLANKMTTQTMKGGNTDAFYAEEGTLPKSEMIAKLHPDVARLDWKFDRWHHFVNYKIFKTHLKKRLDYQSKPGINNFDMELKEMETVKKP
jgi:hypothetical protein